MATPATSPVTITPLPTTTMITMDMRTTGFGILMCKVDGGPVRILTIHYFVGFVILMCSVPKVFLTEPGFDRSPSEDERLAEAQLRQPCKQYRRFF